MRELVQLGHGVHCYEEVASWSLDNLMKHEGERGIEAVGHFRKSYPELDVRFYQLGEGLSSFLNEEMRNKDVVLLHEWNNPAVVNGVLGLKERYGFVALLHDSHHRAYTQPEEILRFQLHRLDGVLAFGEAIRRIYVEGFRVARAWTFHEAADITEFMPRPEAKDIDLVWIGNWGDEERTRELQEFLIRPATALVGRKAVVYGVRYPEGAVQQMQKAGMDYRGYLPNLFSPEVYARSKVTLHVPRRQYAKGLAGIPTIRVFEALACGIPLVCSPWTDAENLFRRGEDYLMVKDGDEMKAELEFLFEDANARRQLAENGMHTIRARHTCAHRAQQLISICEELAA